jgi:hypothetical protein
MLMTRWYKRSHFMNGYIRRYLSYAVGEVLLVIVGIVIVLQIGAWHEDQKIRDDLSARLHTVAENISQDIISITRLKRYRTDAIFASNRLTDLLGEAKYAHIWYTRELVQFASTVIAPVSRRSTLRQIPERIENSRPRPMQII